MNKLASKWEEHAKKAEMKKYRHDAYIKEDGTIYVPIYGKGFLDKEHLARNTDCHHVFNFINIKKELHLFKGMQKPKEYKFTPTPKSIYLDEPCSHSLKIKAIKVLGGCEFRHLKCTKCGVNRYITKEIEKPKRKKQMFGKKKLKEEIDNMSEVVCGLHDKSLWAAEVSGDVKIMRSRNFKGSIETYGYELTVPELKEKASKQSVKDLLDVVESLTKSMQDQNKLIKKLCPHKDVELSKERVEMIHIVDLNIFRKTCKLCGSVTAISEKEYYEAQKGIVDSKLKEIDD